MRIGSLFSGYGGLDMGVQAALGGDVAWHCENDHAASRVLAHRFPGVPNLGDITAVDWSAVEPVEVLTGGFPCQDVSTAGKRTGLRPDTRSGLWTHMAYAIGQLRPRLVVAENVRGLLSAPAHSDVEPCTWCVGDEPGVCLRALGAVLGDLAELGYDAQWVGVRASDVGAPHGRFRVFVVAQNTDRSWTDAGRRGGAPVADAQGLEQREPLIGLGERPEPGRGSRPVTDPDGDGLESIRRQHAERRDADGRRCADVAWGVYEPAIRRWERLTRPTPAPTETGPKGSPRLSPQFVEWLMGLPAGWATDVPGISRNDQLKVLGNGVVPQQTAYALRLLLNAKERAA